MLSSTLTQLLPYPQLAIWKHMCDPDAAREWMDADIVGLPAQAGAPFGWLIDAGARLPSATYGRVTDVIAPETLALRAITFHGHHEVSMTIELTDRSPAGTLMEIHLAQFPTNGSGPFELDGYRYMFAHLLHTIDTHLAGTRRSPRRRHARIGIVPVGADPERGLLVHDITLDTPAETAGLRAGDLIASTSDGTWFTTLDDLDRWLDTHQPGDQVRLQLHNREVDITFDNRPSTAL
jgi:PDZ domain-containing protein